jgi:hypothetical protein
VTNTLNSGHKTFWLSTSLIDPYLGEGLELCDASEQIASEHCERLNLRLHFAQFSSLLLVLISCLHFSAHFVPASVFPRSLALALAFALSFSQTLHPSIPPHSSIPPYPLPLLSPPSTSPLPSLYLSLPLLPSIHPPTPTHLIGCTRRGVREHRCLSPRVRARVTFTSHHTCPWHLRYLSISPAPSLSPALSRV